MTLPISSLVQRLKSFSTLVTQINVILTHQDGCQNNYPLLSKHALTNCNLPSTWSFGLLALPSQASCESVAKNCDGKNKIGPTIIK